MEFFTMITQLWSEKTSTIMNGIEKWIGNYNKKATPSEMLRYPFEVEQKERERVN